jgi:hypothetical protein
MASAWFATVNFNWKTTRRGVLLTLSSTLRSRHFFSKLGKR